MGICLQDQWSLRTQRYWIAILWEPSLKVGRKEKWSQAFAARPETNPPQEPAGPPAKLRRKVRQWSVHQTGMANRKDCVGREITKGQVSAAPQRLRLRTEQEGEEVWVWAVRSIARLTPSGAYCWAGMSGLHGVEQSVPLGKPDE